MTRSLGTLVLDFSSAGSPHRQSGHCRGATVDVVCVPGATGIGASGPWYPRELEVGWSDRYLQGYPVVSHPEVGRDR